MSALPTMVGFVLKLKRIVIVVSSFGTRLASFRGRGKSFYITPSTGNYSLDYSAEFELRMPDMLTIVPTYYLDNNNNKTSLLSSWQ